MFLILLAIVQIKNQCQPCTVKMFSNISQCNETGFVAENTKNGTISGFEACTPETKDTYIHGFLMFCAFAGISAVLIVLENVRKNYLLDVKRIAPKF